jgi:hypothetical protein
VQMNRSVKSPPVPPADEAWWASVLSDEGSPAGRGEVRIAAQQGHGQPTAQDSVPLSTGPGYRSLSNGSDCDAAGNRAQPRRPAGDGRGISGFVPVSHLVGASIGQGSR